MGTAAALLLPPLPHSAHLAGGQPWGGGARCFRAGLVFASWLGWRFFAVPKCVLFLCLESVGTVTVLHDTWMCCCCKAWACRAQERFLLWTGPVGNWHFQGCPKKRITCSFVGPFRWPLEAPDHHPSTPLALGASKSSLGIAQQGERPAGGTLSPSLLFLPPPKHRQSRPLRGLVRGGAW